MGDIADMMLDGELCEQCGEYLGDAVGYPRCCDSCAKHEVRFARESLPVPKVKCPKCNRKVKSVGLADHMRDAHKSQPC